MIIYRSILFTPGNNLRMIFKLTYGVHPDAVILDLEDSVPLREKDTARLFIRDSIKKLNDYGHHVYIRINSEEDMYEKDLIQTVQKGLRGIVIPKAENPAKIKKIIGLISDLEKERQLENGELRIILIIETAKSLLNINNLINIDNRIFGVAVGIEDLLLDMGIEQPTETNTFLPRALVAIAAHAYQKLPIDKVYTKIHDMIGLEEEAKKAVELGYLGKLVVHPRQIPIVNRVFTPSEDEYHIALEVVKKYEEATEKGLGATTIEGELVDKPIYLRAKKLIDKYISIKNLERRWLSKRV